MNVDFRVISPDELNRPFAGVADVEMIGAKNGIAAFSSALLRRDDSDCAGGVRPIPVHQIIAERLENSAHLTKPKAGVVSRRGMRDADRPRSARYSFHKEAIDVIA